MGARRRDIQKPHGRNKLGTCEKPKEGLCVGIGMSSRISGGWQGPDLFTPREMGSDRRIKQGSTTFQLLVLKDHTSCWLENGLEGKDGHRKTG